MRMGLNGGGAEERRGIACPNEGLEQNQGPHSVIDGSAKSLTVKMLMSLLLLLT